MQKNSQDFSMQEVIKLANSPAGQQLLAMLHNSDSAKMEQAAKLAAAGDYAKAAKLLESTLSSEQAQRLIKQLGG
jgi:hypothetical protein